MLLWEEKQSQMINHFLYKKYLYDDRIEISCKNESISQVVVVLKITFKQF